MDFLFRPKIFDFFSLETKQGHFSISPAAVWLRVLNVLARMVAKLAAIVNVRSVAFSKSSLK
jgi:hypothetical protein